MSNLGLFEEFSIDIEIPFFDVLQFLLNHKHIMGVERSPHLVLSLADVVVAGFGVANRAFFVLGFRTFVHPQLDGAFAAVKFLRSVTVVSDVFEIEFATTRNTLFGVNSLFDEVLDLMIGRQVERGVAAGILNVHIHTTR